MSQNETAGRQEEAPKKALLRTYEPDEIILREGETRYEMYKILSGSVIAYLHYGREDEHVVGVYSKSRCFGEWNLFMEQPSDYTFAAYDQVLLMQISRDSLEDFIRMNPQNIVTIMQNMAQSLNLMRKNVDLLLEEVYVREGQNQQKAEEIRQKILRYSNGFVISGNQGLPNAGHSIR